jgi:hypothetical protein
LRELRAKRDQSQPDSEVDDDKEKPREDWIALAGRRRLAKDHWQGVDVDGTILDIIEAEEGLSPAIDACLPAAGVFPAPINRFRQIAATR